MEYSTLHSNLSSASLPAGLNRPRFYDDLEPMSPNQLTDNAEYGSYRVHNAKALIIGDDMVCGYEEPQKKLRVQENKGVVVSSGNKSQVNTNTRNNTNVSISKAPVPRNRRNYVQPSICQVINIDDDEEDEDSVEFISGDDDDCVIIDKPSPKKGDDPQAVKENVSSISTAIAQKRIEEEEYRRAVEYRQRQYFMGLQMRQYMNFMANQNRMQARNSMPNLVNQEDYGRTVGHKFEEGTQGQGASDELNLGELTSTSTSLSQDQNYEPLQITITLDKETDFDFLEQQEIYEDLNSQNITTLEQSFYLKQSKRNETRGTVKSKGGKRGRPRKYPLEADINQGFSSEPQVKVIKTVKKPKVIETMVGEEFQVQIPPCSLNNKKLKPPKRSPKLMWNPELAQKETLDTFLADLSRATRQEISNEEAALHLLQSFGMDTARTIEVVRKNKQLYRKVFEVVVRNNSDKF
jgi:hypothetical protein